MAKSITPTRLLIGAALAFGAWVYLYALLWFANGIWPAGGIR